MQVRSIHSYHISGYFEFGWIDQKNTEMDTKQKIDVVKSSYATLVVSLPINEIINRLHAKEVLTSTALKEIRALPLSQSKTMYLLDNFILRSLRVGMHKYFDILVEVLINSETSIAQDLGKQLKEGKVKSVEKTVEVQYGKL